LVVNLESIKTRSIVTESSLPCKLRVHLPAINTVNAVPRRRTISKSNPRLSSGEGRVNGGYKLIIRTLVSPDLISHYVIADKPTTRQGSFGLFYDILLSLSADIFPDLPNIFF